MVKNGFTLLELLIVVSILAILAAISFPQYQNFLLRSQRSDAVITLNTVQKLEMSYFVSHGAFLAGTPGAPDFVNRRLGISEYSHTTENYGFSTYHGNVNAQGRVMGYYVGLLKNLDPDIAQDILLIKYRFNGNTDNDARPLMADDDLTNTSCVEICYPL